jgi:hypothetical protein
MNFLPFAVLVVGIFLILVWTGRLDHCDGDCDERHGK